MATDRDARSASAHGKPGAEALARRRTKARVLAGSVADLVVDMLLPTLVYLALRPLGVPADLALAAGGIVVGGKAQLGVGTGHGRGRYAAAVTQVLAGLVILFGAHAAGVPAPYAMAGAAVPMLIGIVLTVAHGRRLDGFALLVILEVAATITVSTVSDDPRFLAARTAVYTAVAGVFALATCFTRRPLMVTASKPMAVAGDPQREAAFERAAETSDRFHRIEVVMTAILGVVLLAEAALRVVVVYSFPEYDVAVSSLAAQAPAIALLVVAFVGIRFFGVPRLRAIVDAEQELLRAEQRPIAND